MDSKRGRSAFSVKTGQEKQNVPFLSSLIVYGVRIMTMPPKEFQDWDESLYRECFQHFCTCERAKQPSAFAALKELRKRLKVPPIQTELLGEWQLSEKQAISMVAEFDLAQPESYRQTIAWNSLFDVPIFFRERANGHIFMDPMPGPQYFHAYYDDTYGRANLNKCRKADYLPGKRKSAKKLAEFLEQSLAAKGRPSSRGSTVLEVGAGIGCLIEAGRKLYQWQPEAVEMVPQYVSHLLASGFAVHQGDFVSLADSASSFGKTYNLVLMDDVLEHLPDPARAARAANAVLKRGGALLVQTPELIKGAVFSASQHVNNFSETSLRELLEQNGFDPISFERSERDCWEEHWSSGRHEESSVTYDYYHMQVVAVKSEHT